MNMIPESEPQESLGFAQLGVNHSLIQALAKIGICDPSPIQKLALPPVFEGRDLIALAKTGSGKTAACLIPLSQKMAGKKKVLRSLILVPTRELAMQYVKEAQKIAKSQGLESFSVFGGCNIQMQASKLRSGVDLLVATPGRLIDLIQNRYVNLSHIETLVLDEADEMLGMGFVDDLTFIANCLVQKHQKLLFSATMSPEVRKLARNLMSDPLEIGVVSETKTPDSIEHNFSFCKSFDEKKERLEALLEELQPTQSIIFCSSRISCDQMQQTLRRSNNSIRVLHAGFSQSARTSIIDQFRKQKIRHLVATDVAARGLDFNNVTHVFVFDIGKDVQSHVHRIGRTGRYGREGSAITLVTNRDLPHLNRLCDAIGKPMTWMGPAPVMRPEGKPQGQGRGYGRPSGQGYGRSSGSSYGRSSGGGYNRSGDGMRGRSGEGNHERSGDGFRGRSSEGYRGRSDEGSRGRSGEGSYGRSNEGYRGRSDEGSRGRSGEGFRGRSDEGSRGRSGEGRFARSPGKGRPPFRSDRPSPHRSAPVSGNGSD